MITLAASREMYWINGSISTIKHYLRKCALCINRHTKPLAQMMGNLAHGSLAVNQPAFTNTEVDFYGPFTISQGCGHNAMIKVRSIIFTNLSTRAVYLDKAASLSMAHCLNVI